jgi:ribulose-5-phosphate 4-epimerase/fuculose-1-phosphate aldolase
MRTGSLKIVETTEEDTMNIQPTAPIETDRAKEEAFGPAFSRFKIPTFETLAEERQHRKARLAGGFRIFAALGFSEGVVGHITARDPEFTDTFWVNPFGMDFGRVRASDLIRVDRDGKVVEGEDPVNVTAFAIHAAIHEARPEVVAAAHTHSIYGKAWSAVGRLLDPITQDACAFYEDHVFFDDTHVLVTEASEAASLARCLGPHKAAILRNHGLLTVGLTVEEAVWWFISMERCCQAQFLAESVGQPLQIDPSNARATRAVNGAAFTGWFQCQPLWDRIVRTQPEVLQ